MMKSIIVTLTLLLLPQFALSQVGVASYYGQGFHGKKTASGTRFNMYGMTAAHRTLKFGTKVKVTNLNNKKYVFVTITDRGPYIKGRIIDLSKAAKNVIDMDGTALVSLVVVK